MKHRKGKRSAPNPTPVLPPVDLGELERAVKQLLSVKKPPGGWPGKPPKEIRADAEDEGDGE